MIINELYITKRFEISTIIIYILIIIILNLFNDSYLNFSLNYLKLGNKVLKLS